MKEEGILSRIKRLEDKQEEPKRKRKQWELPFLTRMTAKNSYKKNKILLFYLKRDRNVTTKWGVLKDGLVLVDKQEYHVGEQGHIFLWKGKFPLMIIKEWSVEPVATEEYDTTDKIDTQNHMIRAIEAAKIGIASKISPTMWIWIGIGVIIVAYVLFSGK